MCIFIFFLVQVTSQDLKPLLVRKKKTTSNFIQTTPEQRSAANRDRITAPLFCLYIDLSSLLPVLSACLDVSNLLLCRDCPIQRLNTNCSKFNLRPPSLKRPVRLTWKRALSMDLSQDRCHVTFFIK